MGTLGLEYLHAAGCTGGNALLTTCLVITVEQHPACDL